MSFERIHVSVIDNTRPFATTPFNIPVIIGTSNDPEAVKDTLKKYSSDDITAVAADFPTDTPEYETVVAMLAQDPHPELFYVYSKTRSATPLVTDLSDALVEIIAACETAGEPLPYFVLLTEHEEVAGDLAELADSVSAQMMILATTNALGKTASQIVASSVAINSDRVVIIAHDDPDEQRPDAALVGYWAGMEVGSLTLDTKPLNGVAAALWTSGDMATFMAKKGIAGAVIPYVNQAGVPVTVGSWTTNGTYADMRRAKDWLKTTIEEAIFSLKLHNTKIPQTDHGAHMVQSAIEGVLNRASSQQILQQRAGVGRWEVDIPTLDWLTKNDPTALYTRHLRTIRIRVWPVGAWEEFTIIVYLSWEAAE